MEKNKYVLIGSYACDYKRAAWIVDRNLYCVPVLQSDFLDGKFEDVSNILLAGDACESRYYEVIGRRRISTAKLTNEYHYQSCVDARTREYYLFVLAVAPLPKNASFISRRNCLINLSEFIKDDMDKAVLTHALHETANDKSTVYRDNLAKITSTPIAKMIQSRPEVVSVNFKQMELFGEEPPFPPPEKPKFKFIDLFAGIGGFRIAMQNCGGKCVFTSEFDPYAQKTYQANFGEFPFGDITKQETHDKIPENFDIVCAGFPCQAFSLAGKRLGFKDNFKGMSRGTLFAEVVKICEKHQPKAVFCENVKGLYIHDKGNTFKVIKGEFEKIGTDEFGNKIPGKHCYRFFSKVLNSKDFGVPQNRERIYMVALRDDYAPDDYVFEFPQPTGKKVTLENIRERNVPARYYLSDVYMDTLIRHRKRHEAAGHGFGYEIRKWDGIAGAIVCGGMGRERNLVQEEGGTPEGLVPETHIKGHINKDGIRKMTPREWARLQGFPEEYRFVLNDVHLYKQFGNSVSVPAIQAISQAIVDRIQKVDNA